MPAPNVTITTPANNATVSGTIPVSATVSDADGIASVVARVGTRTLTPLSGVGGSASKSFPVDTSFKLRPKTGLTRNMGYIPPFGIPEMSGYRGQGFSTVRLVLNLENYTQTFNLPNSVLDYVEDVFAEARASGVSLIWGICYSFGFKTFNAGDPTTQEPGMATVKNHILQLKSRIEANKDVIACFFFGIAGAWGEHFTFYNGQAFQGLCTDANLTDLKDFLLLHYPQDRQILNRYIRHSFEQAGTSNTGWYTSEVTQAEAYGKNGTQKWRNMNHCDSAMNGGYSNRTYEYENGTKYPVSLPLTDPTIQRQETYLRNQHIWGYNYFEGGSNNQYVPNAAGSASGYTRRQAIDYLKDRRVSFFNFTDVNTFSRMQAWMGGNDAESQEWRRTIGYNIWLKSYAINVTNTTVNVVLNWENIGAAGMHQKQPFFLELGGVQIQLSADAREQIPRGSSTGTWSYSVPRPAGLTPGTYPIKLWLPDDATSLRNNPLYAVPISSTGMTFNTTDGRNYANQSIIINSAGAGTGYNYNLNTLELPEGTNTITVTATDNVGETTVATVNINVDNIANADTTPPNAFFLSPTVGTTVGGTVLVRVNAVDAQSGVDRVDYYIDNVLRLSIPKVSGSTYHDFNWDTTEELNGSHTIMARCYDNAGNLDENLISVTVNNAGAVPVVNVLSPKRNAIVKDGSRIRITVTGGVPSVAIYIDDVLQTVHNTTTGAPYYDFNWDSTTYADGSHVIRVVGILSLTESITTTIPVIIDNVDDPLPEDFYHMQVFTPTRRPVAGRTTHPQGLVATYTSADFTIPEWKVDGDGNLVSGFFKSVPLRQDGTRRVDIQKDDIVTFYFDRSALFTALVDVPPNQNSMGAGILADPQDYEVYELKSPMELLDKQLMPDVAIYNDRSIEDVTFQFTPKRSISELAKVLERYLPTSIPKLNASDIFKAPHAEFYQPARTMRQVYQSLLESTNNPEMAMWFDVLGELFWDTRNTSLGLDMTKLKGELLPPEPGRLVTSATLQLLGENKLAEGLKEPEIIYSFFTPTNLEYKPKTLSYTYSDPINHPKYGAADARQIGLEPSMLRPTLASDGLLMGALEAYTGQDLNRLIDKNDETYVSNSQIGTGAQGITLQLPIEDSSVYGMKIRYRFLKDVASSDPQFINLFFGYQGALGAGIVRYELPTTGESDNAANAEIKTVEFRFLPPRDTPHDNAYINPQVNGLSLVDQVRFYEIEFLRIDTRPDKTLETLAKKLIVLPENDPGEVVIDARNDPRNSPQIPGYVQPYSHLNLQYSPTDIRRRKVESIEYRYADGWGGWESTLRWGRRDPPSDLADQIRLMREAAKQDANNATALAVRRIEA